MKINFKRLGNPDQHNDQQWFQGINDEIGYLLHDREVKHSESDFKKWLAKLKWSIVLSLEYDQCEIYFACLYMSVTEVLFFCGSWGDGDGFLQIEKI